MNLFWFVFNLSFGIWNIVFWSNDMIVTANFHWFIPIAYALGAVQISFAIWIIVDQLVKHLQMKVNQL